jgi:TonB family protein
MEALIRIGLFTVWLMILSPPQNTREFLQHLGGQHFILRHYTGLSGTTKGECDLAVEVIAIAFEKSSLRLRVRNIGTPTTSNAGKTYTCSHLDEFSFEINGFDIDQPPEQAEKIISSVLQTPEAYLAALGIPWNATPSIENKSSTTTADSGMKIGKAVLMVHPHYAEASRKAHTEGKVFITCVIGRDGRPHDPVIEKGLSTELDKLALDALSFYRFEPPYAGGHAVAVRVPFEISFRPD